MCEVLGSGFDTADSAGWYSGIARLLAGFALLAVLLPLDHDMDERTDSAERSGASGIVVFTSAVVALVILAVTYAILAGHQPGAVAVHAQQLNGAVFGLAALLLILGRREVLRLYGHNHRMFVPAQGLIARVTGIYGPIMMVTFQFSRAMDVQTWRAGANPGSTLCEAGFSTEVWINIGITAAAITAIALIPLLGKSIHINTHSAARLGRATLMFTIAATVWWSSIVPFLPSNVVGGATLEHIILSVTAVASIAFGATAWFSRSTPSPGAVTGATLKTPLS